MRRACKVSLAFATAAKRSHIAALVQAYRAAVNFYIKAIWNTPGSLDGCTLAKLGHTRLSARYKSQALRQALGIVTCTKRAARATAKTAAVPVFRGSPVLDAKFVSVEVGMGSFDLVVRLSGLRKGKRLVVPSRHTAMTRKWLAYPGASFDQGCAIGDGFLTLWVNVPGLAPKADGEILGLDIGVNKLLADSTGATYGTAFKDIAAKIRRKQPKSKAKQRALAERLNYLNRAVNALPWGTLKAIGYEALKGLKHGKRKNRSKAFRKAIAPWAYRQVINRIEMKAQENRVCPVSVDPAKTSQTCPVCNTVARENRKGERFLCVGCGYKADADHVGAQNVLARTLQFLGSVESPGLQKAAA